VGVGDENREDDDVVTVPTPPTTDEDAGDPPISWPTANKDLLVGAKAYA